MTIQIIALVCVLMVLGWLVDNTISNLDALGKGIDFGFLGEPASYDINQRLIDYTSRSPHIRASIVGLLNTLILALIGCVTATILGTVIGILRLSKNWLVARIMTVYVEIFRNVPLLLWILLIFAIMIETLPLPRAFRGENPDASMILWDSVALTNRGVYVPEILFSRGLGDLSVWGYFEISLDLVAFIAVLSAGIFAARLVRRRADRVQEETGSRPLTWPIQVALIIVPAAAVLVALGFHLGYAELKGFNFKGGTHLRNSFIALWLSLSLYTAAFIAEIVRAGIQAISHGQTEAAASLGLRPRRIMSLVILPQALRVIIPPLISQYLNLTKNSSLAIAVGYMDLTGTLGGITLNQTGRELETIMLMMLIYLSISLSISAVLNWYNSLVKLKER